MIVLIIMPPADNITIALGRNLASEPLSPATSDAHPWLELKHSVQSTSSLTDELARRQQLPQVDASDSILILTGASHRSSRSNLQRHDCDYCCWNRIHENSFTP